MSARKKQPAFVPHPRQPLPPRVVDPVDGLFDDMQSLIAYQSGPPDYGRWMLSSMAESVSGFELTALSSLRHEIDRPMSPGEYESIRVLLLAIVHRYRKGRRAPRPRVQSAY